jgi:hypothetical protein
MILADGWSRLDLLLPPDPRDDAKKGEFPLQAFDLT